jgi:hypothetical protein
MGIATFPAASGGLASVIKSLQRGTAATAGNITISSVDTTKTICNSFSTGSAGSVAATGSINAATGTTSASSTSGAVIGAGNSSTHGSQFTQFASFFVYGGRYSPPIPQFSFNNVSSGSIAAQNINAQNVSLNATNLTGGSTSLTSAVYGIHLVNSTTITATGPCRYEVIEYF